MTRGELAKGSSLAHTLKGDVDNSQTVRYNSLSLSHTHNLDDDDDDDKLFAGKPMAGKVQTTGSRT